ncbi:MAG: hypothetical protein H6667_11075 [Ardenticatenaceae bacterium]|nr:hypothetical protein [Ardenticatenaceae bacterium]MCB9444354.1 hypothetical protein [Ardenticatenaceae bacterium]
MDKTITTTFLIVISTVTAVLLFNAVYPAVVESGDAMRTISGRVDDRMKSQIEIIHTAGELDSSGWWQDINGNGDFDVFIWVKNIGSTRIIPVESSDVFFGPEGNFVRIPHESQAGGSYPYWSTELENASQWTPAATLKISIHYGTPLAQSRYYIKVITPNGVADEFFFSM